jgi:hypothetical protein
MIDTILTGILLVMVIGGCFLALLPARTTLHDKLAGTAVYPADLLRARNSFEAVVPTPQITASARTAYPTAATPRAQESEPQNTSA